MKSLNGQSLFAIQLIMIIFCGFHLLSGDAYYVNYLKFPHLKGV